MSLPEFVSRRGDGWRVTVWVQPGARETGIAGVYPECVKIRLKAPAVDNKANKALVVYVAKLLKLKKSQVVIETGQTSRKKRLALNIAAEPDWSVLTPESYPQ
ncbi:DUF167 domain-containing protein [Pseudodesulfovibrio sp.]|nr:DUF167 domain-containing protein [Pseudodesulfovibrio sp.]